MEAIQEQIIKKLESRKSMEEALIFLRTLGYEFMSGEIWYKKYESPERVKDYGIMIRRAGDGKIDFNMYFMVKLWRGRKDQLKVVIDGDEMDIKIKWQHKRLVNFRKMKLHWTFPSYLTHKQRRDWRAIYRKILKHPDYQPPEWYLEALPDVNFLLPIE